MTLLAYLLLPKKKTFKNVKPSLHQYYVRCCTLSDVITLKGLLSLYILILDYGWDRTGTFWMLGYLEHVPIFKIQYEARDIRGHFLIEAISI
jgi:hypothetical protein